MYSPTACFRSTFTLEIHWRVRPFGLAAYVKLGKRDWWIGPRPD